MDKTAYGRFKRLIFGAPIATKHAEEERMSKRIALPIFASDALSSVAYATEEIMITLGMTAIGGSMALYHLTFDFAFAIAVLIILVSISYYQTIHAYPEGGGSYIVARQNLGEFAGEVAGASLLIDYVLTVAVSVSAGVLAVVSMAPAALPYMVPMGLGAVAILTFANMRGARESGLVFAFPTYGFILSFLLMVIIGFFVSGRPASAELVRAQADWSGSIGIILILKAFSSGCTALTGIEAISNGTQAFKEPVARNASMTLGVMSVLLGALFIGASSMAEKFHVMPMEVGSPGYMTVTSQIADVVFRDKVPALSFMFYVIQFMTAAILFFAANTAYAGFPRLASMIAKDGYLPRQLASIGDRLVFQNGIIVLALVASTLIVLFKGDTHKLIPLYAVGVFICFTLSQFGMTVLCKRNKKPFGLVLSAIGGTITLVVLLVISYSKWTQGAYIVPIAIGAILLVMTLIKKHYQYLARELTLEPGDKLVPMRSTVLLLVPRLHKGILQAIDYAKSMATDCRAIHVTLDPRSVAQIKKDWNTFGADIPLVILDSPYRSLIEPIIEYIDQHIAEDPNAMITVIVPQAVPKRWYQGLLHNNAAVLLKVALASRRNVVVTNVRYFLK